MKSENKKILKVAVKAPHFESSYSSPKNITVARDDDVESNKTT